MEGYKYLGLLDADGLKDSVMKEGRGEEHIGKVLKVKIKWCECDICN